MNKNFCFLFVCAIIFMPVAFQVFCIQTLLCFFTKNDKVLSNLSKSHIPLSCMVKSKQSKTRDRPPVEHYSNNSTISKVEQFIMFCTSVTS